MDRRAQLVAALKQQQDSPPVQVWPAVVKSVQGVNCTVDMVGTGLTDVPDVSLRADDEASEGVLVVPRVGSYVYVAAVENAVDNLFIVHVSEVDRIEWTIGDARLLMTKDEATVVRGQCELTLNTKATLTQGQAVIELANGKIAIQNAGLSLKSLLNDLFTFLNTFQVLCAAPGSPSAPMPTTAPQITQLTAKLNQLLT